jgi:hypothetical protein
LRNSNERKRRRHEQRADASPPVGRLPTVGDQERGDDGQRRHAAADRQREQHPGGQASPAQVEQRAPNEEHRRPDEVAGRRRRDQDNGRGEERDPHEIAVGSVPGAHQAGEPAHREPGSGGGRQVDREVTADRVEHGDDRLEDRHARVPRRRVVKLPDALAGLDDVADV